MASPGGDRSEKPTAHRLREARRKGQVARSRDLGQAASLLAALLAMGWCGSMIVGGLADAVRYALDHLARFPLRDLDVPELDRILFDGLRTLGLLVGPLAAAAMAAVILAHTVQGGWVFATEALQMNWGRLNPAQGLKRLGLSRGGLDTLKLMVAVTGLIAISAGVIMGRLTGVAQLARVAPLDAARAGWDDAQRLLRQSAILMVAFGAADYGLQRWRHYSSLRMTRQEVREDFRLTEGNPETKARVRRIRMDLTRRRMFAAIPRASVVITNPTEYAVALEYRRTEMTAPRVVAKGRGLVAARIKEIARAHGIPTVENVPLAQALYKSTEVGESIPAALFEAVAEVLAYLIRLKQLAL